MISKSFSAGVRKFFISIDWKILIFLLLFLNVKVVVKLFAVAIICALHFNFKFGVRFRNSRLPLFYPIVIGIAFINYFLAGGFTSINYNFAFLTGITFWMLCIIAIHQVKLSVERNEHAIIDKTIQVFFIINAIVSLSVFLLIVYKTGHINPYLYQGEYQKYFIGTGDYIKGISFDTSTTNAVFNAFGVIYFLYQKKVRMVLLCMVILLLTGSNITNILLCSALLFVFIFQSSRDQKSIILICLFLLVIFMTKVSPQNNRYLVNSYNELFNKDDIKQSCSQTIVTKRKI